MIIKRYTHFITEQNNNHTFEDLKTILLEEDGKDVQETLEEDLSKLIDRGIFYYPEDYICKLVEMRPSQCHSNSAAFYTNYSKENGTDNIYIATGWALLDGVWNQHSWILVEGDTIVETTKERDMYYGIELNKIETEDFLFDNY